MEEYYYDITVVFPNVITNGNFSLINAANTCSVVKLECGNTLGIYELSYCTLQRKV